jgi:2'-5' RNA ligase
MRLFIAIEIPDDLKKTIGNLRVDIPGARWVPASQIHLTLAFLGEVEESAVDLLSGELARIQSPPFTLCFSGTGCFPERRRPRVLWIGLEPEPRLQALAAKVRATVIACGIPQEERAFSPHITLARLKLPNSRDVAAFLGQERTNGFPSIPVREFTLFQSKLTQQGAVHIPLRNFQLTALNAVGTR